MLWKGWQKHKKLTTPSGEVVDIEKANELARARTFSKDIEETDEVSRKRKADETLEVRWTSSSDCRHAKVHIVGFNLFKPNWHERLRFKNFQADFIRESGRFGQRGEEDKVYG